MTASKEKAAIGKYFLYVVRLCNVKTIIFVQ